MHFLLFYVESEVVVEHTSLSSCNTLNDVTGVSDNEVASHNYGVKSHVVGVVPMNTNETVEGNTDVNREASLSGLKESLQAISDLDILPEAGKGTVLFGLCEILHETVALSLTIENCDAASRRNHKVVEIGQESSQKLEACPVLAVVPVEEVKGTEAAGCEKDKEIIERNLESAVVNVTGDLVSPFVSLLGIFYLFLPSVC